MIRKIDRYNRVSIPREMQKLMGLKNGQQVDLQYENGEITIKSSNETIRHFIISELKRYSELLDVATKMNDVEQIYLYTGYKTALERVLNKYDELY